MTIEFNCSEIQTSFKSDALNFPGDGSCKMEYVNNSNMIILCFKKFNEKNYYDQTQNSIEFTHQVNHFNILLLFI